jgi:hypothetical protein
MLFCTLNKQPRHCKRIHPSRIKNYDMIVHFCTCRLLWQCVGVGTTVWAWIFIQDHLVSQNALHSGQCYGSGIRCFFTPPGYGMSFFRTPDPPPFLWSNFLTLSSESLLSFLNWATLKTYSRNRKQKEKKVCLLWLPHFYRPGRTYDPESGKKKKFSNPESG